MGVGFLGCIQSPRLYRIYSLASQGSQIYEANMVETVGDFAISYLFPLGVMYTVWHRRYQYVFYLIGFMAASYALRTVGRRFNPKYMSFMEDLNRATREFTTENAELIRKYDFEFKYWPVSYVATHLSKLARAAVIQQQGGPSHQQEVNKMSLSWGLSWLIAHSFGIRLMYPGTWVGPLMKNYLEEARLKYVTEQKGLRGHVQSADGNRIDTILFDRRRELSQNGKTLVICFEGNAGFYEIGMLGTPLNELYSVLGWNHPGFGGSSGNPYPVNELNAAEAVFEYATKHLGFKEEEIVLYGWSIGGYPAAYLAAQHPKIKGVVLDATFDDVLPLALPRMPAFMSSLVRAAIRNHIDLRVNKELEAYNGPVRLIRRTDDEIIADPSGSLTGNRGNYLLTDIIRHRYPGLLDNRASERALQTWLSQSHAVDTRGGNNATNLPNVHIPLRPDTLPDDHKASLVVQIAERILTDFKSTHGVPLPGALFQLPWAGPIPTGNRLGSD